ncbi:hypothetical protein [Lacticaseibacillus thailandensis]|nr:hypothetical protein [Lacticaseibacillus thailandensis]
MLARKIIYSLLLFIDVIGVGVALMSGNSVFCIVMGVITLGLYFKSYPVLFKADVEERERKRELRRQEMIKRDAARH